MFRPSSVIILWTIITTINGSSDETMSFLLHTFHKNGAVLQIDFIPYNNYLILMSCRYTIGSSRWRLDGGPISRSWAANAIHCGSCSRSHFCKEIKYRVKTRRNLRFNNPPLELVNVTSHRGVHRLRPLQPKYKRFTAFGTYAQSGLRGGCYYIDHRSDKRLNFTQYKFVLPYTSINRCQIIETSLSASRTLKIY